MYTSAMEFQKPHPSAFLAVLSALSVADPAQAVFVGDRAFDDVHGAKQVGMRAVLRRNPFVPTYEVQPDAVITRLTELPPLLSSW
jgi:putative hydrolase of the HAD superfamily